MRDSTTSVADPRRQARRAPPRTATLRLMTLLALTHCAAPAEEPGAGARFDGRYPGRIERVEGAAYCSASRDAELMVVNGAARMAWAPSQDIAGGVGADGGLDGLRMQSAGSPNWQFDLRGRIGDDTAAFDATATSGAGVPCRWRFRGARAG